MVLRKTKAILVGGAAAIALCVSSQALAQQRSFKVPAQEAASAIPQFARQAGVQIFAPVGQLKGVRTAPIEGQMELHDALRKLIAGTGLEIIADDGRVITLRMATARSASSAEPVAAAAEPIAQLEELVVTGSRLKADGLASTSPLYAIGADEVAFQGASNIETLLNRLPQVTPDQAMSQSTYGTPGIAALNLRGLGPSRTLVLVNGRRVAPGDPSYPYADVNLIPSNLVETIDVVTGGASAVYGSDAVAGVVNFKMKRDFTGLRLDYQFSVADHENDNATAQAALRAFKLAVPGSKFDGQVHDFSIIGGVNTPDDKGNLTLYGGYRKTRPITNAARDWAACAVATVTVVSPYDTHVCQGSGNSAYGRFRTNGSGSGLANNPDGSASFVTYSGALGYNSNTNVYLQRKDERFTAGGFAHYELSAAADLYAEVMAMDDRTKVQIPPSGLVSGLTYRINCDNPLLTAVQATSLCGVNAGSAAATWSGTIGYRFANGLQRVFSQRHKNVRAVAGGRGELGGGWRYDVSAQSSRAKLDETAVGEVSVSRAQKALLVRNVNGAPTCLSKIDGTDPNCVPINLFQLGKISQAAYDYLYTTTSRSGDVEQTVLSAVIDGDLGALGLQSPWAARPVAAVFGAEWRRDSIGMTISDNLLSGDVAGQSASKPANGATSVGEVFTELRAPLIEDKPGVRSLAFDAGYRYSDYKLSGAAKTYKVGLNYAPTRDVTVRAGFNHAVRAPTVIELYTPNYVSSAAGADPCSGARPSASFAACQNTGVTAAQYGLIPDCSSSFCNVRVGGNTALKPEDSDTYTAGLVFTPRFLSRFSATVDYYDIKVTNLIATLPSTLILSQCLASAGSPYCGLIQRNSVGSLAGTGGYLIGTNQNTGWLHVSGVDLAANYRFRLADLGWKDLGDIALTFGATHVDKKAVQPAPGQAAYRCEGLYGPTCGQPTPTWRHNLRATWNTPWSAAVSLNWRHIDSTTLDLNTGDKTLSAPLGGIKDIVDGRIAPYDYYDLAATWSLKGRYTLRAGINNLFDNDPPILDNYNIPVASSFSNGNTYSGLYDTLGRVLFVGLTAEF